MTTNCFQTRRHFSGGPLNIGTSVTGHGHKNLFWAFDRSASYGYFRCVEVPRWSETENYASGTSLPRSECYATRENQLLILIQQIQIYRWYHTIFCTILSGSKVWKRGSSFIDNLRWTKCERENKLKFIFTPVYWGGKINLNLFSLPFDERKYIQIYFHSRLSGRENKFEFIFTPVDYGKKNKNSFSLPFICERK